MDTICLKDVIHSLISTPLGMVCVVQCTAAQNAFKICAEVLDSPGQVDTIIAYDPIIRVSFAPI